MPRKPKPDFHGQISRMCKEVDTVITAIFNSPLVYLVRSGDSKWFKIGYTDGRLDKRLAAEQTGNPEELHPIGIIVHQTADGAHAHEQSLHDRYVHCRGIGEWFCPTKLPANLIGVHYCRDLKSCVFCKIKGMSQKARTAAILAALQEKLAAERTMRRKVRRLVQGTKRRAFSTDAGCSGVLEKIRKFHPPDFVTQRKH
jgi:T5orf172 domain